MRRMDCLKAALTGGVSAIALSTSAYAANFNIPGGDLETALNAYSMQAVIPLIVSDEAIKGARTKGAKGELTASAALSRILEGTGFAPHRTPTGAIAVVHEIDSAPRATQQAQAMPVRMAAAAAGIESVVVTSSKIKGDIQTVPIAITALSQEQLTARQIAGGPDLVKEVPNLTFSKTNFTGYNLQIRGIGTQAISVSIDPAVAVAFNDTPFLRNHFFEQEFYDLSQVEVLRGPQGTLYGRNANAGVVNIVSAKPTDQFEAALSADFGNFHNRRYEGMVNLPIVSDKLDLRIAGEWTKRDGYAFNEITNKQTDGRDLWSSRATLRWRPTEDITADLIWEHFQEKDDRLRSGKQLCKTDPGHSTFTAADGTVVNVNPTGELVYTINSAVFSQGCLPAGLYDKGDPAHGDYGAFGVPNGFSLPFITAAGFLGWINGNRDPYTSKFQSTNLRNIESSIEPIYKANNDTLEFNADWHVAPTLTFSSESGYNRDFLWSAEDFNRFETAPGIFQYKDQGGSHKYTNTLDPTGNYLCFDGTYYVGSDQCSANGHGGSTPTGSFCDPQLGCSDRLVVEDLSEEHSWQFSQEFRLASSFEGPFNFSAGGNYLHYETNENYYVFSNMLTLVAHNDCGGRFPWVQGVSDDMFCLANGKSYTAGTASGGTPSQLPSYIDPNPLTNVNDNGHNYFLSKNPYVLNSYALFGEAYYNITPDLKLTGGIRWTDDQKHFPEFPSRVLQPGYGIQQFGVIDQSWKKFSGRAVANWTPKLDFTDQTMVYASFSHGYKAGGANPPAAILSPGIGGTSFPIHPQTFEPEYINAYELGTKNAALDGALVFDADVFYYDYKGYQISQIVDRTSVNINVDATVQGAEIQTTWSPLQGLKFGFNGGYEDTRINNNQFFIDLIDRTYGHDDTWTVMKPWPGEASNCILPDYVAAAIVQTYSNYGQGNPASSACSYAYGSGDTQTPPHVDPVTGIDYATETGNGAHPPTTSRNGFLNPPAGYPGFDPLTAPNNGEGFAKPIGGNQLPNAPHFTVSLTGDYTMPVSESWAATLHSDFYWQSQSMARIFNDRPYDKIRGYSNVNLALILTDATGWQVMGYVKNIFDTTAITGDFLNSDDTGLTTNVFTTDPRLYGVRITKQFSGGAIGEDGFDLFSNGDGKPPQLWLTVGGNFNAHLQADQQQFEPAFAALEVSGLPDPASIPKSPKAGFDWEGSLVYRPEDTDWVLKAGIRYGRSSKNTFLHKSLPPETKTLVTLYSGYISFSCSKYYGRPCVAANNEFLDEHVHESERHTILDFTLGKDVGLGAFGGQITSTIGAGVRIAQFDSKVQSALNSDPHYHFAPNPYNKYHHIFDVAHQENRSFHGIGPEITWDASAALVGDSENGQVTLDWGLNAGLLFGKQLARSHNKTRVCRALSNNGCYLTHYTQTQTSSRSRNVTVPNLGGYAGLSVKYSNAKISFGYRADEFFGAMDGGQATVKKFNRGFAGPYMNLSVGLGG